MASSALSYYLDQFTTVNRGGTKYGMAPHKPVLLLALLDQFEGSAVSGNKIPLDQRLLESYQHHWDRMVQTGHSPNVGLPIYHLQNDGFWKTIMKEGGPLTDPISSKRQFLLRLDYGQFDKELFQLLIDPEKRNLFRMALIDIYFPETKTQVQTSLPDFFHEIEAETLEDVPPRYQTKTSTIEGYVRDWKFQHHVKKAYNFTCCISGFKVEPPELNIIEACHIKPHATFGINTITNGIPLCAHLHRAFDRGLLSISEDYRVLIRDKREYKENDSPFNIRQFERKRILLPEMERFYPSQEHLAWHRAAFGF